MNVELLKKVVAYAEEEPRRFHMEMWYVNAADVLLERADVENIDIDSGELFHGDEANVPPCGAVGCIAGTTCMISGIAAQISLGVVNGVEVVEYLEPEGGWFERARLLLGLSSQQAERLFYPGMGFAAREWSKDVWPEKFATRYFNAETGEERVQVLKERVAHFIATDGRE